MNRPSVQAWRQVWDSRKIHRPASHDDVHSEETLLHLMRLDGYQTKRDAVTMSDWKNYIDSIAKQLKLRPGTSLYEVGCGAGAFLFPLYQQGIEISGCDFSSTMVEIARCHMPEAEFEHLEAQDINTQPFDFVISNGVFIYFPDLDYAERVIVAMLEKSRGGVAILEVSDAAHRDAHEQLLRRGYSEESYRERFKETCYSYYHREWFEGLGKKLGVNVEITPQPLKFSYSPYRFNVFLSR